MFSGVSLEDDLGKIGPKLWSQGEGEASSSRHTLDKALMIKKTTKKLEKALTML